MRGVDTAGCQVPCRGIVDSVMCIRMKREALGYGWVCTQFSWFRLSRWRNYDTAPKHVFVQIRALAVLLRWQLRDKQKKGETRKGSQSAGRIGAETFRSQRKLCVRYEDISAEIFAL
jgi:hypothetical protein